MRVTTGTNRRVVCPFPPPPPPPPSFTPQEESESGLVAGRRLFWPKRIPTPQQRILRKENCILLFLLLLLLSSRGEGRERAFVEILGGQVLATCGQKERREEEEKKKLRAISVSARKPSLLLPFAQHRKEMYYDDHNSPPFFLDLFASSSLPSCELPFGFAPLCSFLQPSLSKSPPPSHLSRPRPSPPPSCPPPHSCSSSSTPITDGHRCKVV